MSHRPDSFSIERDDVVKTAWKFQKLSGEYKSLMGISGFNAASGGDGEFDHVLATTCRMIGELHLVLAQAIYNHGVKLEKAAENFSNADFLISAVLDKALQDRAPSPTEPRAVSD
jgi:hypothetical protein